MKYFTVLLVLFLFYQVYSVSVEDGATELEPKLDVRSGRSNDLEGCRE